MGMPQEPKAPLATPSRPAGTTRGSKPGLLPSRTWLRGARALWKILSRRERCLFVLGILVPALDQVSRLGSLGVTIRAVGYGIRQPLDLDKRLWLSLIILGATLVSVFIQMGASRVKRGLKAAISHLARRLYGQLMLAAAQHPPDERKALVAQLLAEEKGFHGSATTGTAALIEFLAATFLVLVLLGILAWFDWRVGLGLLCAMLGTLTLLRFRVKAASIKGVEGENEKLVEARKALSQKLEALGQRRSSPELLEDYVNNEYDALAQAEAEEKSRLQKRITSAMNFGSALLMALVFLFVSAEGAFDENKIVWMVVFVFGLRMAVSQSKTAMVKWGTMLAEKLTLMQMVRAGLASSLQGAAEGSGAGEMTTATDDEEEVLEEVHLVELRAQEVPLSQVISDSSEESGEGSGDRVLVVGDGHVRAYAGNANFYPVSLGPGRTQNFTSDIFATAYERKARLAIRKVALGVVLLVLGEPDCRWALGRGWNPQQFSEDKKTSRQENLSVHPEERLSASVERIVRMVEALRADFPERRFYVAPVFAMDLPEENLLINLLNEQLGRVFGDDFLRVSEVSCGLVDYPFDSQQRRLLVQDCMERELRRRGHVLSARSSLAARVGG